MQVLSAAEAEAASKGKYLQLSHPERLNPNAEDAQDQTISQQQILPAHADVTDAASAIALQNAAAAALAKRQSHRKLQ